MTIEGNISNNSEEERTATERLVAITTELNNIDNELANLLPRDIYGRRAFRADSDNGGDTGKQELGGNSSQSITSEDSYLHAVFDRRPALVLERNELYRADSELARKRLVEIIENNLHSRAQNEPGFAEELISGQAVFMPDRGPDYEEYQEIKVIENRRYGSYGDHYSQDEDPFKIAEAKVIEELKQKAINRAKVAEVPIGGLGERVSSQTAEFLTNRIVAQYLSYSDAELPEEAKQEMLDWSLSSESANTYARAIANAANEGGLESVRNLAKNLRDTMLAEASRLNIPISPHGKSSSWAMWDIGKQYYFFSHQNENDSRYGLGNPIDSELKKEEIINRHLGWEAYAAFQSNLEYRNRIINNISVAPTLKFFNTSPKENGTLSSYELAELGKLLRAS